MLIALPSFFSTAWPLTWFAFIPFLLALFLAIICAPAVAWLTRHRVPVGVSVLIVVVVLLLLFSGFGAIVGGSVNEFTAFAAQYQTRFDGVVASLSSWLEAHDIDPESLDLLNMLQPGKLINMLGGVLKATGMLPLETFQTAMEKTFPAKIKHLVAKNKEVMQQGYDSVS